MVQSSEMVIFATITEQSSLVKEKTDAQKEKNGNKIRKTLTSLADSPASSFNNCILCWKSANPGNLPLLFLTRNCDDDRSSNMLLPMFIVSIIIFIRYIVCKSNTK